MNITVNKENLYNQDKIDSVFSEITIPADLSRQDKLKDIFDFLKVNKSIVKLSICDDYLDPKDKETKYFCRRVNENFPNIEMIWIRELKIDGRHGR